MDIIQIVCAICDRPIEGPDLDARLWLHEEDCPRAEIGWCLCDIEVHSDCHKDCKDCGEQEDA